MEELIKDLSSDNDEIAEFAMSALLIANPQRHLSDLINALDYCDDIAKQRICYIFGGMIDQRCINPLLSALKEKNIDTRIAAIDSLQYFPEKQILPHLRASLKTNNNTVREAVISTLSAYIKHGVPESHIPLINIILNENESPTLRHLALRGIKNLEDDQLKEIIPHLKDITDASIYSQILILEEEIGKNKKQKLDEVNYLIKQLLHLKDDILAQKDIEDQLVSFSEVTATELIKYLLAEPENTILKIHVNLIFDKLGSKSIPAIKSLFESFNQFDDFRKVIIIQNFVAETSNPRYSALTKSMLTLLFNLSCYIKKSNDKDIEKSFHTLKSYIHLALAVYGSSEGVDDIKEMFGQGTKRMFLPLIEAIKIVGDRQFVIPLLNQYQAYKDLRKPKSTIKKAFKSIIKREKIYKNDPIFDNLSEIQKKNLALILK